MSGYDASAKEQAPELDDKTVSGRRLCFLATDAADPWGSLELIDFLDLASGDRFVLQDVPLSAASAPGWEKTVTGLLDPLPGVLEDGNTLTLCLSRWPDIQGECGPIGVVSTEEIMIRRRYGAGWKYFVPKEEAP